MTRSTLSFSKSAKSEISVRAADYSQDTVKSIQSSIADTVRTVSNWTHGYDQNSNCGQSFKKEIEIYLKNKNR